MEKHEEVDKKKISQILWHNFLGGIAWGLGVTIGVAILLTVGGFILSKINLIPVIGTFVSDVVKEVQQNNPNL